VAPLLLNLRKDITFLRAWIIVNLALALVISIYLSLPTSFSSEGLYFVFHFLKFIGISSAIVSLFLLDPFQDDTQFILTRPVDKRVLILSKFIISFGILFAPLS